MDSGNRHEPVARPCQRELPVSPMPAVCRVIHRVMMREEVHQIVMIDLGGHLDLIKLGHTTDVSGNPQRITSAPIDAVSERVIDRPCTDSSSPR